MDDVQNEIAESKRRLSELEAKQSLREEKREFIPDAELSERLANYDPLDGVGMPANAMKPIADLVNPKGVKFDRDAWARNRLSEPGGFGSPADPSGRVVVERGSTKVRPDEEMVVPQPPRSYWSK